MDTNNLLEVKAALQIRRPAHDVFEAIADPDQMSNYFISKGSARMETGVTVTWRFPEFDFEAPVRVGTVIPDKYISFYWDGENSTTLFVQIHLDETPDASTVVRITEVPWKTTKPDYNGWLAIPKGGPISLPASKHGSNMESIYGKEPSIL